jgi:hypothetical protein
MGKIYSQARQVLIWLGAETDHDSEALNAVSQLETILRTPPPIIGDIHALNTPEFLSRMINSIPRSSWLQIAYLLQRPWFQRVWVIQEVLVAHSAQLFNGSKSIAWSTLAEVAEKIILFDLTGLFAAFKLAPSALKNICLMRPENSESRRPFFKLLCSAREFKSTDPRDKLYALLGISDSDAVSWESPDYTIQVSRLFIQYTKQELISGSLAHLSATNYIDDTTQVVLPTWVPDWSRPVEHIPFEALGMSLNAGGTRVPRLSFSSNNDLLIIMGKRVSSVDRLGTIRYSELTTLCTTLSTTLSTPTPTAIDVARLKLSVTQWLLDWLADCHKTAFGDEFSPTQEMLNSKSYRRFCKAICHTGDLESESPLVKTIVDRLDRLYLLLSRSLELQSSARPLVNEDESEIQSTIFDLDRYFAPFANYRYLCSDDSGRLAWVPRRARAGDVFCVFHGAKVPHLLRLVPNGQYEMIGACYLQDCMDGEVIKADKFAVDEFVLV